MFLKIAFIQNSTHYALLLLPIFLLKVVFHENKRTVLFHKKIYVGNYKPVLYFGIFLSARAFERDLNRWKSDGVISGEYG